MTPADVELGGSLLHCEEVVRMLPRKRLVCRGLWSGRNVFVKFYQDTKRARVHWQRDISGINALVEKGIRTAEVLYSGEVGSTGEWVIVLAEIPKAVGLDVYLDSISDDGQRLKVLESLVDEVTAHHISGLLQTDVHLGNFVFSDGVVYSLDGAGIRRFQNEVGKTASIENLALLIAQFYPENDKYVKSLLQRYVATRGWECPLEKFNSLVRSARDVRLKKYLGKVFRNCTEFEVIEKSSYLSVIKRAEKTDQLLTLLHAPDDSLVSDRQLLKDGNTCTVWNAAAGDKGIVIKRYNTDSRLQGIKHRLGRSRALNSWRNANMLNFLGIATPRPVAIIRKKEGWLTAKSYFLTRSVDGVKANKWFCDDSVSWPDKLAMASKMIHLFNQMKLENISHGDLKANNFLLINGEPLVIDLDSMKRYRSNILFQRSWKKDMDRFLRNWSGNERLVSLFSKLIEDSL